MSCTTILAVKPDSTPEYVKELKNSHGSAPVIWNEMSIKYLGVKDYEYHSVIARLWPIYKDLSIPQHQRAVLMMTYDRAYISKKHFSQAASDIRKFLKDFPPRDGQVNHWVEIAELYETNPDYENIGLHCTSVSENPFQGEWDEENDEYMPLEWSEAFEIYNELEELSTETVES